MNTFSYLPVKVYNSMLPHGAKNQIAKRAGVSRQSVNSFFKGKTKSKRIEDATLDYLADLKEERESKLRKAGLL